MRRGLVEFWVNGSDLDLHHLNFQVSYPSRSRQLLNKKSPAIVEEIYILTKIQRSFQNDH